MAPVQRAMLADSGGKLRMRERGFEQSRSQDLEPAYHDAGVFCWGRASAWIAGRPILDNCTLVEIARDRVVDIDTPEDWRRAEIMHAAQAQA